MKTTHQIAEQLCDDLNLHGEWLKHIKTDLDKYIKWCESRHVECLLHLDWTSVRSIVYECTAIGDITDSMLYALNTKQISEFELSFMTPDDFEESGHGRSYKK